RSKTVSPRNPADCCQVAPPSNETSFVTAVEAPFCTTTTAGSASSTTTRWQGIFRPTGSPTRVQCAPRSCVAMTCAGWPCAPSVLQTYARLGLLAATPKLGVLPFHVVNPAGRVYVCQAGIGPCTGGPDAGTTVTGMVGNGVGLPGV